MSKYFILIKITYFADTFFSLVFNKALALLMSKTVHDCKVLIGQFPYGIAFLSSCRFFEVSFRLDDSFRRCNEDI